METPSESNRNPSTHEVAPIFSRIWAAAIDNCLVLGAISSATISAPQVAVYSSDNLTIVYISYLIYFISFEALTGQTLGKRLLGIAVTTKDFTASNFKLAFRRYSIDLLLILCNLALAAMPPEQNTVPTLGDWLIPTWLFANGCIAVRSKLNVSLRDRLAGSMVINCNKGSYSYPTWQIATLLLVSPVSISFYAMFQMVQLIQGNQASPTLPIYDPIFLVLTALSFLLLWWFIKNKPSGKWNSSGKVIAPILISPIKNEKPARNIIAVIVTFLILFGGIVQYFFNSSSVDIPKELEQPRVVEGSNLLSKKLLAELKNSNTIDDLKVNSSGEIFAASRYKYTALSSTGDFKNEVVYPQGNNSEFVFEKKTSLPLILAAGSWQSGRLLNSDGKLLWELDCNFATDDATIGDLNGDGEIEFIFGYNGGDGIQIYDKSGKLLKHYQSPEISNVGSVQAADLNSDGIDELYYSQVGGTIYKRELLIDSDPQIVVGPSSFVHSFQMVNWPDLNKPYFHFRVQNSYVIADSNGSKIRTLNLTPLSDSFFSFSKFESISWQRTTSNEALLAIVSSNYVEGKNPEQERSILEIFSIDGKIVYKEVLRGTCAAVETMPYEDQNTLLVGCDNKVFQYQ